MRSSRPWVRQRRRVRYLALAGSVGLCGVLAVGTAGASESVPAATTSGDWTVYHGTADGSGVAPAIDLSAPKQVWRSAALKGELFGEPLEVGGHVYVATTADVVYELDAATGAIVWSTKVGTAVPATALPCGDIGPTVGIVGTPVIDTARHELYAVADRFVDKVPVHTLVGIDIRTGHVLLTQDVDPPGASTAAILQRTGLTLAGGRVVFGYGGNSGDCSSYNGWITSVPEAGGPVDRYKVEAGASQGAVWMAGAAPVIGPSGNVFVATGNGSSTSGDPGSSDSILKLTPTMGLVQSFTPSTWETDNANDYDLGSSAPVLLSDGQVLQAGKSQTAYLMARSHLGGIGGEETSLNPICGNDVDGGAAFVGNTVYLPCVDGTLALTVGSAPAALSVEWTTSISASGPPIVAGGSVWTIDGQGTLLGLNPRTGATVHQLKVGAEANHFPTPSVGDGLLLAPGEDTVVAFEG